MSGGFEILKVGDMQNMGFRPNDVSPYNMPKNEREELCNGGVKGKKWANKTNIYIMQKLWPKILETLPEQINGAFMMLCKRIYFDRNKKSLKS